jgi:predicted phage gp36 major capsid-like protein
MNILSENQKAVETTKVTVMDRLVAIEYAIRYMFRALANPKQVIVEKHTMMKMEKITTVLNHGE